MNSSWTIPFSHSVSVEKLQCFKHALVGTGGRVVLFENRAEWRMCLFVFGPEADACCSFVYFLFFRRRSHARGFSPCEASLGATVSKACGRREFS